MRRLYLKTQADVLDLVENTVKDASNLRWANNDIYRAINVALRTIYDRVSVPFLYDISGGFVSGTYEYTLPAYVGPNFTPYIKTPLITEFGVPLGTDYDTSWRPLVGWVVEPTATGGRNIRLLHSPPTEDGRIVWYGSNGEVPLEAGSPAALPKLNAEINSTATSLVLSTLVTNIGDSGYVKIDGEWIGYAGVSFGTATTTLSNLTRALYGTTAATHASTTVVYWGIAVDDMRLWGLIEDMAVERLHYILLHRGTRDDSGQHERIMGFLDNKAETFFRRIGYVPARSPQWKPSDIWR